MSRTTKILLVRCSTFDFRRFGFLLSCPKIIFLVLHDVQHHPHLFRFICCGFYRIPCTFSRDVLLGFHESGNTIIGYHEFDGWSCWFKQIYNGSYWISHFRSVSLSNPISRMVVPVAPHESNGYRRWPSNQSVIPAGSTWSRATLVIFITSC